MEGLFGGYKGVLEQLSGLLESVVCGNWNPNENVSE